MTPDGYGQMRVSDADRDSANAWLTTAFAQGRLTKDEYDERLGQVLSSKTYAQLATMTADLPGAMPGLPALAVPAPGTNSYAVASLVCGLCQFIFPPIPTVLAIVFGHVARGQIRRSGQTGVGMATGGLVLGWAGVAVALLVFVLVLGLVVAT